MFKELLISSFALNFGVLLGRISGFARESLVAFSYGTTAQADIVVLMLTVPDLLVNILMGGALGAVLVPEFSQCPKNAHKLLYQSLLFFGIVFVCLAAVLYCQADMLVRLLAPGFKEAQVTQAAVALGWVIWLIPLTVLAGIVTAYLQSQNRFAIASLGTLIINSAIIVGLVLVGYGYGSLPLLALFVLLGGLLRLISQLLHVRPGLMHFSCLSPLLLNKRLLVRYVQAMLSGSVLLLLPVVAKALASYEGEGSVALFNYAIRLVEFPLAIAVTFLVAVFFPRLSQSFTSDPHQHRQLVRYGVQITLGLSIVSSIPLIYLSDSYADIVYGHGGMQHSSVVLVATITAVGLVTLPLQGLARFMTSVFNARKDTYTPLLINGFGLAVFVLTTHFQVFGHGLQALMWGMVACYGLICASQFLLLKVDALSLWQVLLDKAFLLGAFSAATLSAYISNLIGKSGMSAPLSLLLSGFVALLCLLVMAMFNGEFRYALKVRLSSK